MQICQCIKDLKISYGIPFSFNKGELYEFQIVKENKSIYRIYKDIDLIEVKTMSIDKTQECIWGFYNHKNSFVYNFKNYFNVVE